MSGGDWGILSLAAIPVAFFVFCAASFWVESYSHQRDGNSGRAMGCILRAWQHAMIAIGFAGGAALLIVTVT